MTQQHKLTVQELIAWHKRQADYYKSFGSDNAITNFYAEAAELIEALESVALEAQRLIHDKVS